MSEIKNNTALAVKRATAIARSVESLSSITSIKKDESTTVKGNANASTAIDLAQSTAKQMSAVVSAMSQNIQNLSSAFHAMDQKAAA
ncbi:TIGR04197 family type VII secretion effector [Streptococcus sp. zg-86]|uniref:TIGR04197 family type VII secretion effector n=1 Tax=Streptococcus zhangguiae TaxID=2664091 RepID=A0ABW9R5G3_9STRE|nr:MULTISPECIES: TIGR04197 family type VII secretion effector [unclassified Streptococcus]MTB63942.1 TIGR04197 family type VII secretion effector [Streptococcus sp. zg-86]MTB90252.1 TIGR04197 family type VII secretion effector [Streptococcus sp. zg-36]QTH46971.1 TIGR04197 family type VII secretion effector [Streptococcus sp. zg-86]